MNNNNIGTIILFSGVISVFERGRGHIFGRSILHNKTEKKTAC